jgi:hypothetical protein
MANGARNRSVAWHVFAIRREADTARFVVLGDDVIDTRRIIGEDECLLVLEHAAVESNDAQTSIRTLIRWGLLGRRRSSLLDTIVIARILPALALLCERRTPVMDAGAASQRTFGFFQTAVRRPAFTSRRCHKKTPTRLMIPAANVTFSTLAYCCLSVADARASRVGPLVA